MLKEKDIKAINQIIANGNTAEVRKRKDAVLILEVQKRIKTGK